MGIGLFALVGCGDDDGGGGGPDANPLKNTGFIDPTVTMVAYNEANGIWNEVGPADFSCFNTASTDTATTVDVTISGPVEDFQTGNELPEATITAYGDTNFSASGLVTTVSDIDGNYSMVIPTGQTRLAYEVDLDGALPTYSLNNKLDPNAPAQSIDQQSVSELTANALPAFIGVTRTVGLGVLAGTMRDCNDNEVGGAIATVSSVAGSPEHLDGAQTYYFSAGSTSLPVRHSQQENTNTDGIFVVIELAPNSQSILQVYGYLPSQNPMTDEITLVAEIPSPVLADSVITASMEPLRTN
jgi:hypothetical protein